MNARFLSALFALFLSSVLASPPNANTSSPHVKRVPDTLQARAPSPIAAAAVADSLSGLVEIRAPSDYDLIATPVVSTESEPELGHDDDDEDEPELESKPASQSESEDDDPPAPQAAPQAAPMFALADDSPLLEYDGAKVLQKRANCPA